MSRDNTTVTLTVLTAQAKEAEALFDYQCNAGPLEENSLSPLTYFVFHEVDCGNLDFLESLAAAGIAFDSKYQAGVEYTAGTDSLRFTAEGETKRLDIYDEQRNPDIDELLALIDQPSKLRKYILAHKEQTTVEPLDEYQIIYGKIYRTKLLIAYPITS